MKSIAIKISLFLSLCINLSFGQVKTTPDYRAIKCNSEIVVDGKMDEKDWFRAEVKEFTNFYKVQESKDKQKTEVRLLWDIDYLYAFFQCEDDYILARENNRDGQPYLDDCAELFLIPTADSQNFHFCFEVNVNEAINDVIYLNEFYNGKNGVIKAYNPNIRVASSIQGTLNDNSDKDKGWTMEFAIPLKVFNNLRSNNLGKEGTKWRFMAVRMNRNEAESKRISPSTLFPLPNFKKGLHQPNQFGLMEFVE